MSVILNVLRPNPEFEAKEREVHLGASWRTGDLEFLNSEKAMSKVRDRLGRLPYNFNIAVVVDVMKTAREQVKDQEILPNYINVVLCNNVTTPTNWIPLTSWMMIHRLGHCISSGGGPDDPTFDPIFRSVNGPEFETYAGFDEIYGMLYGQSETCGIRGSFNHADTFYWGSGSRAQHIVVFLGSYLMTMKSAREKVINNELDVFAEMLAQFMIKGKVKLNRLEDSGLLELADMPIDQYKKQNEMALSFGYGVPLKFGKIIKPQCDAAVVNAKIEEVEAEINRRFAVMCGHMVGRQFSF